MCHIALGMRVLYARMREGRVSGDGYSSGLCSGHRLGADLVLALRARVLVWYPVRMSDYSDAWYKYKLRCAGVALPDPKGQLDPPSVVIGRVLGQFNRGLVFGLGVAVALRLVGR
jgi:hypothetical protein